MKNILKKNIVIKMVILSCLLVLFVPQNKVYGQNQDNPIETDKEIIYYLMYTSDEKLENDINSLQVKLELSDEELEMMREIGLEQYMSNKKVEIDFADNVEVYNLNIHCNAICAREKLQLLLGDRYDEFLEWIDKWWEEEREYRSVQASTYAAVGVVRVYATQFEPNTNGSVEVALPDKYLKFANRAWWSDIPDEWKTLYSNPPYTVVITGIGKGITMSNVLVNDAGPWNIDDNYWSDYRREFTDLPIGVPEAQAAFFDGYNNGLDDRGRIVKNQAGIDMSIALAAQLGFATNESGYVYVNFYDLP